MYLRRSGTLIQDSSVLVFFLPVAAVEVATVVVDAGLDPGQILSSITQTLRYSGLLPPTDPVPHGAMKNSKSVPFQVAYTPHPQSTVLQVCSTEVDEFPPYLNQMVHIWLTYTPLTFWPS